MNLVTCCNLIFNLNHSLLWELLLLFFSDELLILRDAVLICFVGPRRLLDFLGPGLVSVLSLFLPRALVRADTPATEMSECLSSLALATYWDNTAFWSAIYKQLLISRNLWIVSKPMSTPQWHDPYPPCSCHSSCHLPPPPHHWAPQDSHHHSHFAPRDHFHVF